MNSPHNTATQAKLTPNFSLKDRNTFGLDAIAQIAFEITEPSQIPAVMSSILEKNLPWRVLGGGSNVILPKVLPGATLLINITGSEVIAADESFTKISVGAGVNWHEFVAWTLENGFFGLENLALIPGTVGAAPIQNIGAYGVELAD